MNAGFPGIQIWSFKMKKVLGLILVSFFFSVSAQAFEISTRVGSSVSSGISVNSYTASGTVTKIVDSQRDIFNVTAGVVTVGSLDKHSVTTTHVNQGGAGVGGFGSSTVYASMSVGNIEVGGSASVGGQSMNSVAWDNSAINEVGTSVAATDSYFGPFHVGSNTETVFTNTWVNLANVDYTASSGSWSENSVYAQ